MSQRLKEIKATTDAIKKLKSSMVSGNKYLALAEEAFTISYKLDKMAEFTEWLLDKMYKDSDGKKRKEQFKTELAEEFQSEQTTSTK